MRILLLTGGLPYPLASGGAIRSFGIIHGLHAAGHEVTLLSFHDAERGTVPNATPLAELCARIETAPLPRRTPRQRLRDLMLSGQPDIAKRLDSDEFRHKLQMLLDETAFDLVQFDGLETAGYFSFVRQWLTRHNRTNTKLCYDSFNAEYVLQRLISQIDRKEFRRLPAAAYSFIQSNRIAYFERMICQEADFVIAVSEEDAEALRPFRPDRCVYVVPNGIFADDYANQREHLDLHGSPIIFTGKMDYRPNVDAMLWFTDAVLPLVTEQVPDARLYIVGQKPHSRLEGLRVKKNVEVTGWVAEVQPFLQAAEVYVAPLRMGSGTRLKILEAMASGCAVVATSTAASGLLPEAKRAMLIADDADSMAQAVITLLQDPAQRQALGDAARDAVRQYYDWSVLIPKLLAVYKEIGLG